MAYTSIPSVVTGQTFSAANYNTYVKDNINSLWPYAAVGDIAYASAATTLARLALGAAGTGLRVNSAANGLEYVKDFTQLTSPLSPTGWGASKATGTYTITMSDFSASLPSGIKAALISVSAAWAAASGANVLNIRPNGAGSGNGLVVRAHTTYFQDNMGVVPCNSSNQLSVVIDGAAATVYIDLWGYWR